MPYVIQKTILKRWNYWVDERFYWNGLIDNARIFKDDDVVGKTIFEGLKKDEKVEELIERSYKSIRGKPRSDVSG